MICKLFNKKRYYNQVVLYRHVNPDLDAYGSQLGLYWVIKTYLPDINVVLAGDMSNDLLKLFPSFEVGEFKKGPTLGIVLDTANRERIDGDISVCDKILKIDHHIVVDSYGDMNIEHESASSCSEIVTLLLKESYIDLPIEAANALYLGIVGDSNRFLYKTTTKKTFKAVSFLLDAGVQIEALIEYTTLFMQGEKTIESRCQLLHEQRDKQLIKLQEIQASIDRLNYKIELYETGQMTEEKIKERRKRK